MGSPKLRIVTCVLKISLLSYLRISLVLLIRRSILAWLYGVSNQWSI